MRSSNPIAIILDQYRLMGPNFIDCLRNLKVVLASEKNFMYQNKAYSDLFPKMLPKRS